MKKAPKAAQGPRPLKRCSLRYFSASFTSPSPSFMKLPSCSAIGAEASLVKILLAAAHVQKRQY